MCSSDLILLPLLYLLDEPFHLAPAFLHPQAEALTFGEALRWLVSANVSLVLFNMIPAFPLDGGRILRGALGLWFDWPRATRWATRIPWASRRRRNSRQSSCNRWTNGVFSPSACVRAMIPGKPNA